MEVTSELLNLEVDFFKALTTNEGLAKFDQDLPSFVARAGEAYSNGSVSENEAKLHLARAHKIQVVASCVAKVQLDMDTLCQDITNRFKFSLPLPSVAPSVAISPSSAATSVSFAADDPLPKEDVSSAASQSLLKNWSLEHLSSPYPTRKQRAELASLASMSDNQVMLWFRNARTRSGWTKLYAHVQKDQARLKMLLEEYHSLRRLHGDEEANQIIACDEGCQLVEKVLQWFDTEKKPAEPASPKSVRPWVKEVISRTLETLKRRTSDAKDSQNRVLPAFPAGWDSRSESSLLYSNSSVASTSSVGSSSRFSSTSPPSSRSSNSSIRSTSPASTNTSISPCRSPTQSLAPSACSNQLADNTSSFPPLPSQLFDYSSPETFSSPLCMPTNDSSSPFTSIFSGDLPAWPAQPPQLLSGLASLQRADSEIEAGQFDDAIED